MAEFNKLRIVEIIFSATPIASCRNGTGITEAEDWDRVKTSFTVAKAKSVFVGTWTTLCEFFSESDNFWIHIVFCNINRRSPQEVSSPYFASWHPKGCADATRRKILHPYFKINAQRRCRRCRRLPRRREFTNKRVTDIRKLGWFALHYSWQMSCVKSKMWQPESLPQRIG